jgi:hypothetical protein
MILGSYHKKILRNCNFADKLNTYNVFTLLNH